MKTSEIRQRFLDHFANRGHTVVPSASLLLDDPNLLFVNAGMVPFKPYFLGQVTPPYQRATSVQKCVRTLDIEEVGKTTRHGSFFQMNGNFSFGDYFKEEAIRYAWELITTPTQQGGFGLPESKLWVTVYHDDDESAEIWRKKIGVPANRIVRRGMADNYWSMGVPGPCGPCSEIYIDRGPEYGRDGGPEVDEDRFLEFWNLVFMQYERGEGPAKEGYEIFGELPSKNIDTGMGLERMSSLLQGVDNLYEIDQMRPLIDAASALTGKPYGVHSGHAAYESHPDDVRLRVIADHIRTGLMMIGDGVVPGNEGRGYVLRRILRRAIRSVRLLGYEGSSFEHLFPVARDAMKDTYPELEEEFGRISTYAYAEEDAFTDTLRQGTTILDTAVTETKEAGRTQLGGETAFKLHDTYGFPIDLTLEIAAEHGVSVDEEGFRRLMKQQRERAQADALARKTGHGDTSAYRNILETHGASTFTGYYETQRESRVVGIINTGGVLTGAGEGEEIELVLDSTPFYAEGGGQLADLGEIITDTGRLEVLDVQSPLDGVISHRAKVVSGEVRPDTAAEVSVDVTRRRAVSQSHSATHLVHQALRDALGESAAQAGSLNAPGRLRFDFTSPQAVPEAVLRDVEEEVNEVLLEDLSVRAFTTSQEEARRIGALAMFGEKYGDEVRVVEIGEYSRELCGGTHVPHSSTIGLIKLLGESSIGAGTRRVEAFVGVDAAKFSAQEHILVSTLAASLKARPEELPDRIHALMDQLRSTEKELAAARKAAALASAPTIAKGAKDLSGVMLAAATAPEGVSGGDARTLAADVASKLSPSMPGVAAIVATKGDKLTMVVATNAAARDRGVEANTLVKAALSGRGGGSAQLASGGGFEASRAPNVLTAVEREIHDVAARI